MTSVAERLLPTELRARRGRWSDWQASPPVTASDIRRWAIAVYWPEPPPRRYVDPDAAVATVDGRMVAPEELNPFAWAPPRPAYDGTGCDEHRAAHEVRPGTRRLFGGCRIQFGARIAEGDVVRRRVRVEGWTTKRSGAGDDLVLVDHTHEWRNDRDELVRLATYTLIYREAT